MSKKIKLVIEINEDIYQDAVNGSYSHLDDEDVACAVADGVPLNDVKAEIREKSFNHYFECGEYIGEDCRKERIIYSDQVLEILDNLGKGDKE